MKKTEQATRVKAVTAYLAGIGCNISSVQGYEILARSLGYKNKHVLGSVTSEEGAPVPAAKAAKSYPNPLHIEGVYVPVMALTDDAFSVAQMREMKWDFDVIIPFAVDQLDDIDTMNDYASLRITGNDCALEGIGFNHVPDINYGKGWTAYRVTGSVSAPKNLFDDEATAQEATFYADLLELANHIVGKRTLDLCEKGSMTPLQIWRVNAEARQVLWHYARTRGANNNRVNSFGSEKVFECRGNIPLTADVKTSFLLHQLKHARKRSACTWSLDIEGREVILMFTTRN